MSSSKNWLKRHHNDQYVKKARKLGMRSRAAFKLEEIQKKYSMIKSHDKVIDLGASPGSWSELCIKWLPSGKVIACDLLEMEPIKGVHFVQGDFNDSETQKKISDYYLAGADVIISDMSPNKTGVKKVDQWQASALCESVIDFSEKILLPGGSMVFKCFHGSGFEDILLRCRKNFNKVKSMKPEASRKDSTEVYIICLAKKDKD